MLLVALAARVGVVSLRYDELSSDPDAYVAVARQVADGRGYTLPETGRPTAYRPPLYPLLLAAILSVGGGTGLVALVHVALGTATVLLVFVTGRHLLKLEGRITESESDSQAGSLNRPGKRLLYSPLDHVFQFRRAAGPAALAALLVAVDPLLVRYTALPMTETLATFLLALLVFTLTRREEAGRSSVQSIPGGNTWKRSAIVGLIFGLAVLCRPTIWAFGGLAVLVWLARLVKPAERRRTWTFGWPVLVGAGILVSPWVVRNLFVFDKPILTTTHGGYTLLLGNNPVFYEQVVARPLGTTWDDAPPEKSQQAWLDSVRRQMRRDLGPGADDEVAADWWMTRRALENIRAEPVMFLKACIRRFLRFWNVVPLDPARGSFPSTIVWGTAVYYAIVFASGLLGLVRIVHRRDHRWLAPLLLLAAFCVVHLFYWSNTRMRAPVTPVIALLAAGSFTRRD